MFVLRYDPTNYILTCARNLSNDLRVTMIGKILYVFVSEPQASPVVEGDSSSIVVMVAFDGGHVVPSNDLGIRLVDDDGLLAVFRLFQFLP